MKNKKHNPWFYVSLLPSAFALIGILISSLAHVQDWGAERDLSLMIRVFFYEITFVVSALGLLAYLAQRDKTPLTRGIRWLNLFLLLGTLALSVHFFLN